MLAHFLDPLGEEEGVDEPPIFGVFGRLGRDEVPTFLLPSNPVSALVSFEVFVAPALRLLSGRSPEERRMLSDLVLMALNAAVDAPSGTELQLSVETVELDRPSYAKVVRHG